MGTLLVGSLLIVPFHAFANEPSRRTPRLRVQIPTELRNTTNAGTKNREHSPSNPSDTGSAGDTRPSRLTDTLPPIRAYRERQNRDERSTDTGSADSGGTPPTESKAPSWSGQGFRVGITYPGVTMGIRRRGFALEFKALHQNDITILGGRIYNHVYRYGSGTIYWTADASTVKFEGDRSEGNGVSFGLSGGLEKFLGPRLSWKLDMGPYITFLEDESTGIDEEGLAFVINTGLTYRVF